MRNYSREYKRYYDNIKQDNIKDKKPVIYNSNNFENIYGNNVKKKSKKEDFFSSMTNIFIYQLVVVLLMLMTVFYLKYSANTEATQSYNNIKAVINNNVYEESINESGEFDISSTLKKINEYIKVKISGDKLKL